MNREQVREFLGQIREQTMANFAKQKEGQPVYGERMEFEIAGQKRCMRHYASAGEKPAVYFDIHGGGFTWGTIEDGTFYCKELCDQLVFEVYSLDYPLVPDTEYPQPLYYVYDIISYMRAHAQQFHFDPERMIVGGRSASANLAAALCLLAKERGEFQFALQVLDHPWLDLCGIFPWEDRYQGTDALTQEVMNGLALGYADPSHFKEITCSPLAATEKDLIGLPKAVIQTCECDSLRPEGEAYAQKLEQAGVPVISHCFPKAIHGFTESNTKIGEEGRRWLLEQVNLLL